MEYEETPYFPGAQKPGENGLYKRRFIDKATGARTRVEFSLWSDDWWYEGSTELTSALNMPLRKSHYQAGVWEDFEWCGVMPGSYERPDVQEVKTANFVGGFFAPDPVEPIAEESEVVDSTDWAHERQVEAQAKLDLETPPAPETVDTLFATLDSGELKDIAAEHGIDADSFTSDFFGGQS